MSTSPAQCEAVILSGSVGQGHGSVAQACAAALDQTGLSSQTLDAFALLGRFGAAVGDRVFRSMLSVPPVYDAYHFSQMRAGTALVERLERQSAKRVVPRLRRAIGERHPALLLSVFASGAGAIGRLRSELPDSPAVVMCTDATAHRFWVHPGVDRYVVGSAMAAGTVRKYLPQADIVVVPPPVRRSFFEAPSREQARRSLGVDEEVRCVLLMAGGWGLAPLQGAAEALASAGTRVLAVAGRNCGLLARLRTSAGRYPAERGPGVSAFGFTENVSVLMAAADVVVTSAGQTCHEARVAGRPLVVLDVVPGHGRENLLLELEHGGAVPCTARPEAVVAAVELATHGIEPPARPWPVSDVRQWQLRFVSAIGDLIGVQRPGADAELAAG